VVATVHADIDRAVWWLRGRKRWCRLHGARARIACGIIAEKEIEIVE